MDTIYRGLASAQNTFALGRPDIGGAERPGAILAAIVGDALTAGLFERARPSPSPRSAAIALAARAAAPAYAEREDFGAFDDLPEMGPGH